MKYDKDTLIKYSSQVTTVTDLVRLINNKETVSPSSIDLVSKKLKAFNINTSHFIGSLKGSSNLKREQKTHLEVLIKDDNRKSRVSRSTLLNAIRKEGTLKYECELCFNDGMHNGSKLLLNIDHIDGNWKNNLITNLRFLCPNCHSQTETFGFNGTIKY